MVKILIEKDLKELPSRYILSRWRKDVKHRYNFITNCYDDLKSGEQVKHFDHLRANFYEAANIVDSPEKYEYLMKCLDETKEKLIDASSWGVNLVSNSIEEELLPPWKVRGRGRPPKRKKSTIEKLTKKHRNKNNKNVLASQGKKDKLPGKRGSFMSNLTDKINVDSVDMTNNTGNKHRAIFVNENRRKEGFDINQSASQL
nr:protein FAR1-related sequence 5-like [Tanacetum cinerariifolium]